jgi:hypothetical protein
MDVLGWRALLFGTNFAKPPRASANLENDVTQWHAVVCVVDEREFAGDARGLATTARVAYLGRQLPRSCVTGAGIRRLAPIDLLTSSSAKASFRDGQRMSGPFLIRIDETKFADIPNKVVPRTVRLKDPTFESRQATGWIFRCHCEMLLYKNEKLGEMLQQFLGRLDDPECWNRLTQGQRILYSLAALDGQVNNGGITQFFWNCPDLVFPASDALAALRYSALSVAFDKALGSLIGKKDKWVGDGRYQHERIRANRCLSARRQTRAPR